MPASTACRAGGKFRTTDEVKEHATEIYPQWRLTFSDTTIVMMVTSSTNKLHLEYDYLLGRPQASRIRQSPARTASSRSPSSISTRRKRS